MPQALINVHSFLQDFNPSKFIVFFNLLVFSILLSLRLDNTINVSYWLVFLPLWIWKGIAICGALVGAIIWLQNSEYRPSNSSYVHFKSMLISVSLQILLLMFEILVCDKLETRRHTWTLAFVPLLFISLLSIPVCVWSVRNGRGIELEFFAAINILQVVLIALKLDSFVNWTWIMIFTPSWILLCFATIIILYTMIFAVIVFRSPNSRSSQRQAVDSASSSTMIFLPMFLFLVLLTNKLDVSPGMQSVKYFLIFTPLFLTLLILTRLSFGSKPGSLWWFGMRTDFCTFLLTIFPSLKEYGNTSFTVTRPSRGAMVADSGQIAEDDRSAVFGIGTSATQTNSMEDTTQDSVDVKRNHTKRFLYSISHTLFRHKDQDLMEKSNLDSPVIPKLTIDMPD